MPITESLRSFCLGEKRLFQRRLISVLRAGDTLYCTVQRDRGQRQCWFMDQEDWVSSWLAEPCRSNTLWKSRAMNREGVWDNVLVEMTLDPSVSTRPTYKYCYLKLPLDMNYKIHDPSVKGWNKVCGRTWMSKSTIEDLEVDRSFVVGFSKINDLWLVTCTITFTLKYQLVSGYMMWVSTVHTWLMITQWSQRDWDTETNHNPQHCLKLKYIYIWSL